MKKHFSSLFLIAGAICSLGAVISGNSLVSADVAYRYELNSGKTPENAGCVKFGSSPTGANYSCPKSGGGSAPATAYKAKSNLVALSEDVWYLTSSSALSLVSDVTRESSKIDNDDNSNGSSNGGSSTISIECPDTTFFGDICDPDDPDKSPEDAIPRLIIEVLNWALVGVGTVVIIFIVLGGIIYMTAAGDTERAKNGVKIITNAVMGLVLYLVMITVLNFLIPGGVFSGT